MEAMNWNWHFTKSSSVSLKLKDRICLAKLKETAILPLSTEVTPHPHPVRANFILPQVNLSSCIHVFILYNQQFASLSAAEFCAIFICFRVHVTCSKRLF